MFFDLWWGPAPCTSSNGFSYYLIFVHAFLKNIRIYLLKKKIEAYQNFIHFKSMTKLQNFIHFKSIAKLQLNIKLKASNPMGILNTSQ